MKRLTPLFLLLLPACGEGSGLFGGGGPCPRLHLPDEILVEDARFFESTPTPLRLEHRCARGGTVQIDRISLDDVDHWAFATPPFRQVAPEEARTVRMLFTPTWPTYSYDGILTVEAGGELQEVPLLGRVDPDQDGDGYEAEQAGGTDCNDLDPEVHKVETEIDDGIDNDCDGVVDEPFVDLGSVRITELLTQPRDARAEFGVWVELFNVSNRTINLRGWRIEHDGGRMRIEGDVMVDPFQRVVIGVEADQEINGGLELDGVMVGDLIPDEPTWLKLYSDGVQFEAEFDGWKAQYGYAMQLDERSARRDAKPVPSAWCPSKKRGYGTTYGSPGAINGDCGSLDFDGDGWSLDDGDCDDESATTHPGGTELWNDADDNCDTFVDTMWIEDRLETELIEVPNPHVVSVGAWGGDGRDGVAILIEGEVHFIGPDDPWAGRPADRSSSVSIALPVGARTDPKLAPELAHLGGGAVELVVSHQGVPDHPDGLAVLGVPTDRRVPADDVARVWVHALPSSRPRLADLDGDGSDEVIYAQSATRGVALELGPTVSGTVEEDDVIESGWGIPGGFITDVRPVDWDDDGYDDLDLTAYTGSGYGHLIVPGGVGLGDDRDATRDQVLFIAGSGFLTVAEVHGDSARDLIWLQGDRAQVFAGPVSNPPGTPTWELQAAGGHTFSDLVRVDFDGDPFDEIVATTVADAAGRAWFLDQSSLLGTGSDYMVDHSASQWAPIRTSWTPLPGIDVDGDGRDSLLFYASGPGQGWLQRVPPKP